MTPGSCDLLSIPNRALHYIALKFEAWLLISTEQAFMFLSFRQYWVLLLSVFLLAACVDSNNGGVTGQGSIRGLHAIPDLGAATFLIEDTSLGLISFKEDSGISSFEDLENDFR